MTAAASVDVEQGGGLRYPPLYNAEEYISPSTACLDAHPIAMMPVGQSMKVVVGIEEIKMTYMRWRQRWKHW